ncbi:DNA-binding protein, partial [Rhizobium ruizarguesonis]
EESAFAGSAADQEDRILNTLFQMQWLKNTFAFALHDADLKQYIFAFSGVCPMPAREQAMALLYGCIELLDKVSRRVSVSDGPSS